MSSFLPVDSLPKYLSLSDLEPLEPFAQCAAADDANVDRYYLLFLYSLMNNDDIEEARFLLKRMSAARRTVTAGSKDAADISAQLSSVCKILASLWTKDYAKFFSIATDVLQSLPLESPEASILRMLVDHVRDANYQFVSRAFLSGALSDIAVYLGLSDIATMEFLQEKGWSASDEDPSTVIAPVLGIESPRHEAQQKARLDSLTSLITHMQRS
ncbi:hypothetical protein V1525DRAFT_428383 [Lipomyces kononenkoae]|uniref:Uncharacterized protein n=1 Tax=Lipomyces kononenkoae TaxID=34357 RepID=A0ACC3SSH8_LIPKO